MLPVAIPTRYGNREHALIDPRWADSHFQNGNLAVLLASPTLQPYRPRKSRLQGARIKPENFCSNASSRSFASAATRLFLAPSTRAAHMTAESADVKLATSAESSSPTAADWPSSSTRRYYSWYAAARKIKKCSRASAEPVVGGPMEG
jgi:hypothetical protein